MGRHTRHREAVGAVRRSFSEGGLTFHDMSRKPPFGRLFASPAQVHRAGWRRAALSCIMIPKGKRMQGKIALEEHFATGCNTGGLAGVSARMYGPSLGAADRFSGQAAAPDGRLRPSRS